MTQASDKKYYEVLQISPTAEPEVAAAAYRALARKYHPDRSTVPDAMTRMARLNVAYQAVRSMLAASGNGTTTDYAMNDLEPYIPDAINPNGSLEQITKVVSHKVAIARERVVAEVQAQGLPRDITITLVTKAFRTSLGIEQGPEISVNGQDSAHLDLDGSYDDAIRIVANKASHARDELADQLVKGGLQRHVAVQLVDSAFERLRYSGKERKAAASRLSSEHVDLSASLERGMSLIVQKMEVARDLVVQELTGDGMPQKTAEQLVRTAVQQMTKTGKEY